MDADGVDADVRALVFFGVATLVLVALHVYVWVRLGRNTRLPRGPRRGLLAGLWVLGLLLPLGWTLGRHLDRGAAGSLAAVGFVWLGYLFYLVLTLAAWDGVRLLSWAPRPIAIKLAQRLRRRPATPRQKDRGQLPDPARRVFVARAAGLGAAAAAGGISGYGLWSGLGDIQVPEVAVRLPRLSPSLSGLRIALLSDVHIGPLLDRRFLRGVVEKTNALAPDIVAITGDLVDGSVAGIGPDVAALRGLKARWGTFFVTGNHEYYSGAAEWTAFLERLGIRVLTNAHVPIGDGSAHVDLAGVPDHQAGRHGGIAADMRQASAGRADPDRPLIMLAHQPVQIAQAAQAGVSLQLSGHTHGGQLFPFGALTGLVQPYLAGLHRHGPDTQIYVSRGTGFWGPPMRVLAPAEIACITLIPG